MPYLTVIELDEIDKLQQEIGELLNDGQILLFLRNINAIEVAPNNGERVYFQKEIVSELGSTIAKIQLSRNANVSSEWLLGTFLDIQVPAEIQEKIKIERDKLPEKLRDVRQTDIGLAAKIESSAITPLIGEDSIIFTYLPTKVSTFQFPFLVNGSFVTTAAREALHEDRFWNHWLFEIICLTMFDWLEMLAKTEYRFQVACLLPGKFNQSKNVLKVCFDRSYEQAGRAKKFVVSTDGKLTSPPDCIIDKVGLGYLAQSWRC